MKKIYSTLIEFKNRIQAIFNKYNKIYTARTRKTNIFDGFLFKLLCGQKNMSQNKAAAKLNGLRNKYCTQYKPNKARLVNRSSYVDRENSIPLKFYETIYNEISAYADKHFYPTGSRNIYAVDGVKNNLLGCVDGLKKNKNQKSTTALTLGVYNVVHNYPVALQMVTHSNERKAFLDFIKDTDKYTGSIFIFDRGSQDQVLFKKLTDMNIHFLCRLRDNSIIIPTNCNDHVTYLDNGCKIRVIKYVIGKNSYYLGTNLFDTTEFSIEILKQLYHKRWDIEEFFKYIKDNMNFGYMDEKSQKAIKKTIYGQLIVSKLSCLLVHINKEEGKHINNAVVAQGLYDEFLFRFFYGKRFNNAFIIYFMANYMIHISSNKGKNMHNERTCNRPYMKWYVKRYFKKYIKIKEDHENG